MVEIANYGSNALPALPDPFNILQGSSIKTLSFSQKDQYGQSINLPIGTSFTGTLADDPTSDHITDPQTREPQYWDAAKTQPKLQVILTLDTDYRDPNNQEDDGKRRLFFKSGMLQALQAEMREKRIGRFGLGTRFTVTLVDLKPTQFQPKKIFKVEITDVTPWVSPDQRHVDSALAPSQPVQQLAQAQAQPVQQVQQAAPSGVAQALPQQAQVPPVQQPVAQPVQQPVVQAQPAPAAVAASAPAAAQVFPTQENVDQLKLLLQANIPPADAVVAVATNAGHPGDQAFIDALSQHIPF